MKYVYIIILVILILNRFDKTEKFSNTNKNLIFEFKLGYGGIGDFIKFMRLCLNDSIKENKKFYINLDHPMNKFIKINPKFKFNNKIKNITIRKPFEYYGKYPTSYYLNLNKINKFNPMDYFKFSDDCLQNLSDLKKKNKIPDNYEAIHIRLGDSKMEGLNSKDNRTDKINIYEKVNDLILKNKKKIFVLFMDNDKVKKEISSMYKNIRILDIKIIHTSECYDKKSRNLNLKNNICDFILLAQAKKIHSITYSGFSIVASWLYSKPFIKYYESD
tara:strand:+ start:1018 stop:1839 length:822 start_codon:yes stop_codon:yes gene_type:complete